MQFDAESFDITRDIDALIAREELRAESVTTGEEE